MALLSRVFVRQRVISLATTLSLSAISFAFAETPMDAQGLRAAAPDINEQHFIFENKLAMAKMSREMMPKPTGDVDRDFVSMMIPHHRGAIDMARAELKYGHNRELRRLAQGIISQQEHEISVMRSSIGEPLQTRQAAIPTPQPRNLQRPSATMNAMKMN
jgi:uncharacterized protein (DUF305 family)